MKTFIKKALATTMALATLTVGSAFSNASNVGIYTTNAATGGTSSPMYAYYVDVPFTVTSSLHKTGSLTVRHSPIKISYGHCSLGQAIIKVTITHSDNSSDTYSYQIPEYAGVSISHTISDCSADDTIRYEIYPDPNVNCVRAEGSVRIYY